MTVQIQAHIRCDHGRPQGSLNYGCAQIVTSAERGNEADARADAEWLAHRQGWASRAPRWYCPEHAADARRTATPAVVESRDAQAGEQRQRE